jgi:hypothetical protein
LRSGRRRDDEGLVTRKDIDDSFTRGIALRMLILGVMAVTARRKSFSVI